MLLLYGLVIHDKVGVRSGLLSLQCLLIERGFNIVSDLTVTFLEVSLLFCDDIVNLFGVLHNDMLLMLGGLMLSFLAIYHLFE